MIADTNTGEKWEGAAFALLHSTVSSKSSTDKSTVKVF